MAYIFASCNWGCYLSPSVHICICIAVCVHLCLCVFLGLRPRRTLRTVLWTAEEQGGVGAQQYYNLHKVLLLLLLQYEIGDTQKANIVPASEEQRESAMISNIFNKV